MAAGPITSILHISAVGLHSLISKALTTKKPLFISASTFFYWLTVVYGRWLTLSEFSSCLHSGQVFRESWDIKQAATSQYEPTSLAHSFHLATFCMDILWSTVYALQTSEDCYLVKNAVTDLKAVCSEKLWTFVVGKVADICICRC